ncbi:MAG: formimidoylglutamate deiminase [Xanthomonadales bacterium]|nr:formimidoylglutamate deiminase [Xanthomonadales bacterium]
MKHQHLVADHAWTADGFLDAAVLEAAHGHWVRVEAGADIGGAMPAGRWLLPGMPNLHSHAFQRAMAGLAERRGPAGQAEDSFWTWRETMYAFAGRIGPRELTAIAAQLYMEMLKAGYTQVCEFHYLHHRPDGRPYDDSAEMSLALIDAAREAGIGLTLLPTLYMSGGFDGRALAERQRRFGHELEAYLRLVERLRLQASPMLQVGIALHSLRAVPAEALAALLGSGLAQDGPIHIHIAEQMAEVEECLAVRGARPVEWLLDHAEVDCRWCLVHATHLSASEAMRLAASGAVAGLCPTTEGNLGDGLFPLEAYLGHGGIIGIGSDSHVSISPVEELRWLEYGQRLATHRRNVAAAPGGSTGERLWQAALAGGAQASGVSIGAIAEGHRADLLVLDEDSPLLAARNPDEVVDSFVFAGNTPLVREVMVAGEWRVRDGRHVDEDRIAGRFRAVARRLRGA